jgi:integrase
MPRLINRQPKYGLHKASGQAVVTIRGREQYLGKHGTPESREKYRQLIEQAEREPEPEPQTADEDTTPRPATLIELRERLKRNRPIMLVELLYVYTQWAKSYHGEHGSEPMAVRPLAMELLEFSPNARTTDLKPYALTEFQDFAAGKGKWCRKHINKQCERIKRIYRWGVHNEIVSPSVWHAPCSATGLKKGKTKAKESKLVKPVDDDVVEQTRPHLRTVVADMIQLQRSTGARPGEICQLRPGDIDRSGEVWQYRPEAHKTEHHDKERIICIGPKAQLILGRYLLRPAESYCFDPAEAMAEMRAERSENRKTPLSCGNRAGTNNKPLPRRTCRDRYDTNSYRRAIHRACDRAFPAPEGLSKAEEKAWHQSHRWSPNQLRHSAGTEVRKLFGLDAAQVVLGHSSANVTEIYAERDQALAARVALEVG